MPPLRAPVRLEPSKLPRRTRWPEPRAPERLLALLALCSALAACRDSGGPEVHIILGPRPSDEATLVPRASLAEYIEISPTEGALLLTLSSEERTCEAGAASGPDASSLSIRVALPAGSKLELGAYPMLGAGQSSDRPHALGTVKLKGHRRELPPGGELVLSKIDANPQGTLEGMLKLEFTGDAERAATRVSGRFLAHFCRVNRLR